ncbi:MAG TPA: hypothetical protein V6D08_00085 [Candidatus Obscuribacterales bacterium]
MAQNRDRDSRVMDESRKTEQLQKENIELKVSDGLEEACTDRPAAPMDGSPSEERASIVEQVSDFVVPPADRKRVDACRVEEPSSESRRMSEHEVVELLEKPDSEDFLRAIEEMSPDQIGRVLPALDERNDWYAQCVRQLTDVPDEPRTAWSVIAWWEARRIVVNLVVGIAGLPTVVVLALFTSASFCWILEGIVAYAIAANVCYTAGSASELLARRWWAEKSKYLGPILFTLGPDTLRLCPEVNYGSAQTRKESQY